MLYFYKKNHGNYYLQTFKKHVFINEIGVYCIKHSFFVTQNSLHNHVFVILMSETVYGKLCRKQTDFKNYNECNYVLLCCK